MMPFAKTKNRWRSRQTFWRIERTPQNHIAEERDTPTRSPSRLRRNLAGTRQRKGNHGLKSPRRLGATEWSARALVSARHSLAEPTGPAPSPHFCGGGCDGEGKGKGPDGHPPALSMVTRSTITLQDRSTTTPRACMANAFGRLMLGQFAVDALGLQRGGQCACW
jgi:hypothetical protein